MTLTAMRPGLGSGELKTGLLHGILRQLGLTIRDLR
jgi:hypothetical protein